MSQEKKHCEKCGMLFTPSLNNPERCPECQRKKRSILSRIGMGVTAVLGIIAVIILRSFGGGDKEA